MADRSVLPSGSTAPTFKGREPQMIYGDYSPTMILADCEEDAAAFAAWDLGTSAIKPVGWMHNVGWDRERFDYKREFVAETGFAEWWEGCLPPADQTPTKKCRMAWEVR